MSDIYHWAKNEVKLACKNTTDDYSAFCYKSALRTFRSLCDDDHSGCSIAFTHRIPNELIDMHPLTPIEDTPDNWESVEGLREIRIVNYNNAREWRHYLRQYTKTGKLLTLILIGAVVKRLLAIVTIIPNKETWMREKEAHNDNN